MSDKFGLHAMKQEVTRYIAMLEALILSPRSYRRPMHLLDIFKVAIVNVLVHQLPILSIMLTLVTWLHFSAQQLVIWQDYIL